ncbi:hmmtag2 [Schizosaccharomyces cryophilus OY26]|uniref:Hmmtag2 n=1 Tax=Schizosaccharomyces cryophilus (strain OY26 / ATCC MYA-4695 / CBS 11777 / NBRC 106824 / NRRL Y48691) TaxID=653667 RepID=S9W124_SCHCR|nr:hmmtag2 [Schizosaccharomyces cryophilus OY26]EPY52169.1 hmmtag2 [Schizosaccharomyces cryophilus OY26]
MGRSNATRGGTRGGQGEFQWDQVKSDKQKGNYLGQSIYAASGRWAQGRDLEWWSKGRTTQAEPNSNNEEAYKKEILEVKYKEQVMLAETLGLPPPPPLEVENNSQNTLTTKEIKEQLPTPHHRRKSGRREDYPPRRHRSQSPSHGIRYHRRERLKGDDYHHGRHRDRRPRRYSPPSDLPNKEEIFAPYRHSPHHRRHVDDLPERDYEKAYNDRSSPPPRRRKY